MLHSCRLVARVPHSCCTCVALVSLVSHSCCTRIAFMLLVYIIIIINNFFFVGIIQHFKMLQIVFTPEKLIKANYKPSKMKVLKDTFQQSFKLQIYWWELEKKKCTNVHTFACTHKHTLCISIYTQASTRTYRL